MQAVKSSEENIAAVAVELFTHKEFTQFRDIFAGLDEGGGYAETLQLTVQMANALTKLEEETADIWAEEVFNLPWMEFVELYVNIYMEQAIYGGDDGLPDIAQILERTKTFRSKRQC